MDDYLGSIARRLRREQEQPAAARAERNLLVSSPQFQDARHGSIVSDILVGEQHLTDYKGVGNSRQPQFKPLHHRHNMDISGRLPPCIFGDSSPIKSNQAKHTTRKDPRQRPKSAAARYNAWPTLSHPPDLTGYSHAPNSFPACRGGPSYRSTLPIETSSRQQNGSPSKLPPAPSGGLLYNDDLGEKSARMPLSRVLSTTSIPSSLISFAIHEGIHTKLHADINSPIQAEFSPVTGDMPHTCISLLHGDHTPHTFSASSEKGVPKTFITSVPNNLASGQIIPEMPIKSSGDVSSSFEANDTEENEWEARHYVLQLYTPIAEEASASSNLVGKTLRMPAPEVQDLEGKCEESEAEPASESAAAETDAYRQNVDDAVFARLQEPHHVRNAGACLVTMAQISSRKISSVDWQ